MSNQVEERPKKAIFLDRDGTIIEDKMYLADPKDVQLLPGAAQAIRVLREHGFLLIVVTNQSGVARGYFTEEDLTRIHDRMRELLREERADFDAIYYCPHFKEGVVAPYNVECECRKPLPGLLLKSARDFNVDLAGSFLVGDSDADIEAGLAAGVKTILVSGPKNDNLKKDIPSDIKAQNLLEASRWVIAETADLFLAEPSEKICVRCGRHAKGDDVLKGLVLEKSGRFLCAECFSHYRALKRPQQPAPSLLDQILTEIRHLVRFQTYREFTVWNILGGILQASVVFTLFLSYNAEVPTHRSNLLLLALVLQTMALSFFILGKK